MKEIFRRLFRRSRMGAEVRDEIESHIAMRAEMNRESGMSPDQAMRAARVDTLVALRHE